VWQTWWFLTLCVAALSLIAWGIYKARLHQIKLRFRAVLDERGRLAREMHDTVIQGCTSISALLEAIASLQTGEPRPGEDLLQYARAQVRTTIDEARHAVWDLRHEQDSDLDLPASLEAIAVQTRKEFAVAVDCHVEGSPLPVPGAITRELLMVVREAVYNAALHGHPHHIGIRLRYEPQLLRLSVADDGTGFDVSAAPAEGHFGITGMRERMDRAGGKMSIVSAPGSGTSIELFLPESVLASKSANRPGFGISWDTIQ
jgi:signal transduction histidine kinase